MICVICEKERYLNKDGLCKDCEKYFIKQFDGSRNNRDESLNQEREMDY